MKKVLLTLLLAASTFLITPVTQAQVGGVIVFPNKVEMDFSKSTKKFNSGIVTVQNTSKAPIRIRTYVDAWELDKNGRLTFLKEPNENSLNNFIKFNPKEFDLAPDQKQIVRITAKLPEGTDGEFRSMIFFETVKTKDEIVKNEDKNRLNLTINVTTRFGVTIFAYKGELTKNATLNNFRFEKQEDKNYLIATISNDGNVHSVINGEVIITNLNTNEELKPVLFNRGVGPKQTHDFLINLPEQSIMPGKYDAKLNLKYEDFEKKPHTLAAETTFTVDTYKNSIKEDLVKPITDEVIEMTPENIAKPEKIDTTEIKLTPEAN